MLPIIAKIPAVIPRPSAFLEAIAAKIMSAHAIIPTTIADVREEDMYSSVRGI
jgi:hypothetical protein